MKGSWASGPSRIEYMITNKFNKSSVLILGTARGTWKQEVCDYVRTSQSLPVFPSNKLIENMVGNNGFFSWLQDTFIFVLNKALWISVPRKHFRGPMNPQAHLTIVILLMNAFLPRYLQQEPVGPATRYVGVKRNRNQSFRKYSGIIELTWEQCFSFCTSYLYLLSLQVNKVFKRHSKEENAILLYFEKPFK